jgi:hypothetical protein
MLKVIVPVELPVKAVSAVWMIGSFSLYEVGHNSRSFLTKATGIAINHNTGCDVEEAIAVHLSQGF